MAELIEKGKEEMGKRGNRGGLTDAILCSVAKTHLGIAGGNKVSPYTLVTKVLGMFGRVKLTNCTDREFVFLNKNEVIRLFNVAANAKKPIPPVVQVSQDGKKIRHAEVIGDDFLSSFQWRQLRMVAIKRYGARCQCCGASAATGAVINVDHIKPRRLFPELALDLENLQILCHECNHGKGNWDQTDWRNNS